VPCYTTEPGTSAEEAAPELALLREGHIRAVALTSSAEVRSPSSLKPHASRELALLRDGHIRALALTSSAVVWFPL